MKPLRDPVHEEVEDLRFREVPGGKRLVALQIRSVIRLTAVRDRRSFPSGEENAPSMSRVDSPRAYIWTARFSSSSVRPERIARIRDRKGSSRSDTWGTP